MKPAEVVDVNPYTTKKGSTKRSSMWEKIADTLNKCAVRKFRVEKRSVRDHVGILVYKHKKKLQAEEKATGITPDCTHFFNQRRNIRLLHSEIGFTFGWVFIREGKLFIRRVRKRKITRPIYLGKQNKLFFACDLFYQTQTEHFLDFLKWCYGYDFCERNAEESHLLRAFLSRVVLHRDWDLNFTFLAQTTAL